MSQILMPRLVEHMEEALVAQWLYADGDQVARGDEIVEIETDKATTALESEFEGILRVIAAEGTMVAVGAPLAEVGETAEASEASGGSNGDAGEPPADPAPQDVSTERGAATPPPPAAASAGAPAAPAATPVAAGAATSTATPRPRSDNGSGRLLASPVARRIASEHGLDLATLDPGRPSGRILKADVLAAVESPPEPVATVASSLAPPSDGEDGFGTATLQELSRTQLLIARRMTESTSTIPDFAVAADVEMTACRELRQQLADSLPESRPVFSYNDMVVKAVALALRDFPRANGSYRDGKLELHSRVNVGVAVAAEDTLVVPTVFDADRATLGTIARTTRELAGKVRDGSVQASELAGGTFTVSNLGMFGISHFSAVINPPQAAILAVGGIEERAVVRDGEVCARSMMTINLVSY